MRCVQALSAAALRRLFQRGCQPAGGEPALAPPVELFAATGHHLTRALRQANARAWFALEVLLAGESFWERAQLEWERSLDEEFFQPLRSFLDCATEGVLASTVNEARDAIRAEVRKGACAGLFATGNLDIPALAQQIADDDSGGLDESETMRRLAEQWDAAGHAALRPLATLYHPDGTALLVLLVAGFLRHAVQADPDLFGDFAEFVFDADSDAALNDAHRWATLFLDHRARIEALHEHIACPEQVLKQAADAYLMRGSKRGQVGEFQQAVEDFTRVLQVDSANVQAFFLRGLAHHREGKLSEALADLSAVLRFDRRHARAFAQRAAVLQSAQQSDKALSDLAHALRLDRRHAAAYCRQLAIVHAEREEFELAVAEYSLVLLLDPKDEEALTQRNDAWQKFIAQRRSQSVAESSGRRVSAARGNMTQMQLRGNETMLMPPAAQAQAEGNPEEETTEFELAPDVLVENAPETAEVGRSSAHDATVAGLSAATVESASKPVLAPPPPPPAIAAARERAARHEELASQREQELELQMEVERKEKMAEFQRRLAESKKGADEIRKKAEKRQNRRTPADDDDEDRMPLWKKGMLAAAACVTVWFLGSWSFEAYANYQSQARFTLARFCRDFDTDATQARKKYDGGAFELTGKAKLVQLGKETRLAIETPEVPQWSVHCRFDLSPKSFKTLVADQIQPGQEVTIEGRCAYRPAEGKGIILMEECVLRKSS